MIKKTFYFGHDYNARSDEKIIKLISKEGWEGYGIYWAIIEKLYEAGGHLDEDYTCIAFDLRTDCDRIATVIKNYNLFEVANKKISSKSVLARLRHTFGISEKNRQNAKIGWDKRKKEVANAMRPHTSGNAIKEKKRKEIKEKENSLSPVGDEVEIIPNLLKDKQKHIQIIGLYAKAKKIIFTSKKHQQSFITRNLKSASNLKNYDMQKITNTMMYLINNADFKWTLETIGKYIDENLNNLNNKQTYGKVN